MRRCGVVDLRSGLGPNRGVMCEVRSGRTTAGDDFDLASRAAAVAERQESICFSHDKAAPLRLKGHSDHMPRGLIEAIWRRALGRLV